MHCSRQLNKKFPVVKFFFSNLFSVMSNGFFYSFCQKLQFQSPFFCRPIKERKLMMKKSFSRCRHLSDNHKYVYIMLLHEKESLIRVFQSIKWKAIEKGKAACTASINTIKHSKAKKIMETCKVIKKFLAAILWANLNNKRNFPLECLITNCQIFVYALSIRINGAIYGFQLLPRLFRRERERKASIKI